MSNSPCPRCPLCHSGPVSHFYSDRWREYLRCVVCKLIFVPEDYHLSPAEEKAEYDLHQNSPDDPGYRKFLSRVFDPVNDSLERGCCGLDFGSGPGPTLSRMFEEAGHKMAIYDPWYTDDMSVLDTKYDFVTSSEVVEHFRNPQESLARIRACVKPGGLIGIMTRLATDPDAFSTWHYKEDRTHICFYSKATFEWLSTLWNTHLTFVGDDVVLLEMPDLPVETVT